MVKTLVQSLLDVLGAYNYNLNHPDYPWIASAVILAIAVWGVIVIIRSFIHRR